MNTTVRLYSSPPCLQLTGNLETLMRDENIVSSILFYIKKLEIREIDIEPENCVVTPEGHKLFSAFARMHLAHIKLTYLPGPLCDRLLFDKNYGHTNSSFTLDMLMPFEPWGTLVFQQDVTKPNATLQNS